MTKALAWLVALLTALLVLPAAAGAQAPPPTTPPPSSSGSCMVATAGSAETPAAVAKDATAVPVEVLNCIVDPGSVAFTVADAPDHGTLGTVTKVPSIFTTLAAPYTPVTGYTGPDAFTLRWTIAGQPYEATFHVAVQEVTKPVCPSIEGGTISSSSTFKSQTVTCTGIGPLTYAIAGQPAHGSATVTPMGGATASLNYTVPSGYTGPVSFTYTASNAAGASAPATVAYTVSSTANTAPSCAPGGMLTPTPTATVRGGWHRTFRFYCSDPDGDPVTVTTEGAAHGTTTNASSPYVTQVVYSPTAGYSGSDSFVVKASDGKTTSTVWTQALDVRSAAFNSKPVCVSWSVPTTISGAAAFLDPCQDGEDDPLTYTVVRPAKHGTAAPVTSSWPDGSAAPAIRYDPADGYTGPDDWAFTASDGTLVSDTAEMAVQVTGATAAPTCTVPATALVVRKDGRRQLRSACTGQTVAVTDPPDHGEAELFDGGFGTYTPDAGYTGPDSMTFVTRTGSRSSAPYTLSFDVQDGANAAPVCGAYPSVPEVRAGGTALLPAPLLCSDPDADPVTLKLVRGGTLGTASVADTGPFGGSTLQYVAGSIPGLDTLRIGATDGRLDAVPFDQAIRVQPASYNRAPSCFSTQLQRSVAGNGTLELDERSLTQLCTDPDGDALQAEVASGPAHGTLSGPDDGVRTYTPAAGYRGSDAVVLRVTDGRLPAASPVTLTISVTALASALPGPVALPGGGTAHVQSYTDQDGRTTITVPRGEAASFPGGCMPLPVSTPIDPAGGVVSNAKLVLKPSFGAPEETKTLTGGNPTAKSTWSATLDCARTGDLLVRYTLTEGGQAETIEVPLGGIVLVDPQGVVYDKALFDAAKAAGKTDAEARKAGALVGATVVLQRKQADGSWKKVLAGDPGISPNVNPQLTGPDGLFQWDVSQGQYRVQVTKDGYQAVTSREVTVPPEVTDLHVAMTRVGGGAGTGGAGTGGGETGAGTGTGTGGGDTGAGGGSTGGSGVAIVTPQQQGGVLGTQQGSGPTVVKPPCGGLTGSKAAACKAELAYAKATGACRAKKGSKKARCLAAAKLARKRALATAKCAPLKGAKRAACVRKAKKIRK